MSAIPHLLLSTLLYPQHQLRSQISQTVLMNNSHVHLNWKQPYNYYSFNGQLIKLTLNFTSISYHMHPWTCIYCGYYSRALAVTIQGRHLLSMNWRDLATTMRTASRVEMIVMLPHGAEAKFQTSL